MRANSPVDVFSKVVSVWNQGKIRVHQKMQTSAGIFIKCSPITCGMHVGCVTILSLKLNVLHKAGCLVDRDKTCLYISHSYYHIFILVTWCNIGPTSITRTGYNISNNAMRLVLNSMVTWPACMPMNDIRVNIIICPHLPLLSHVSSLYPDFTLISSKNVYG